MVLLLTREFVLKDAVDTAHVKTEYAAATNTGMVLVADTKNAIWPALGMGYAALDLANVNQGGVALDAPLEHAQKRVPGHTAFASMEYVSAMVVG